ncbi:hypothetical protein AYO44_11290 [Planctomycetaceae bacterium SCGC AG-212-F19]|nr:hypothetical protein AYO44_11290 [Planctomycetaceae bacterium SCGC AG-212-F19]
MPGGQLNSVFRHICRLAGLSSVCDQTDSELLGRFSASRDEAAFEAMLQRHGPLVLNVCRRVLGNPDDADDAFQATFLVLARKAGSIRQSESVASWLHGVAYRIANKAKVHAARRRDHERQVADMPKLESGGLALWEEMRPLLDEELSRLPQKYRVPIVLRYLQGKSNEEAAREMGCPAGTLSWRLSQALELLRQRLARRGVTLPSAMLGMLLAENAASAAVTGTLNDTTLRAAVLFASGKALAAQGGALTIITLAEGALRAMWLYQLKMVSLLLTVVVLLSGVGFFALRGLVTEAVAVPTPERQTAREPEGGKAVNGLKLTLSADKTETVMKADGSNAEPVKLKLTFTNVSDRAIKLRIPKDYDGFQYHYLKLDLTGPEVRSERVDRLAIPSGGAEDDFVMIESKDSFSPGFDISFPAGPFKDLRYSLHQQGEYRLRLSYENAYPGKQKDSWMGSVRSNELVLKVLPDFGPDVKGLRARVTLGKHKCVVGEAIVANYVKKNVSAAELTIWHSVFWPNHQVRVKDAAGKEPPLTEAGAARRTAFAPGGGRDKNAPWSLKPGQEDATEGNYDITNFYDLSKPGRYTLQYIYEEKQGGWEGRLPSNEAAFEIVAVGKEVNGLKLTLSADSTETVMKADGSDAEPVTLKLTFTNVSDKPIKLDAFLLGWYKFAYDVTGPTADSLELQKYSGPIPKFKPADATSYPLLKPQESYTYEKGISTSFPGRLGEMTVYRVRKPGDYRIRFGYKNEQEAANQFAKGSWTGTLTSNELILKVLPAGGKEVEEKTKPSSKRTLDFFKKNLDKELTPAKAVEVFGEPDGKPGSGLNIYAYVLDDGSKVWLAFRGFEKIFYAKHIKTGKTEDLPLK